MKTTTRLSVAFCVGFAVLAAIVSCEEKPKVPTEQPVVVMEDSITLQERIKEIDETVAMKLTDGITATLWATDSLAPDPIALDIDDIGRVYITRTNRQKNSEFDIRGHRDWMTESIGLQTVEERRAFLHKTFAPEKSEENSWLKDLNNDSIHDWHDLAVEKDEVWRIEDTNGDGIADASTRILEDFNDEITDVAGGLLVRDKDVFVAVGPDLWRLEDTNGDQVLDTKESLAHGFAVHIGFSGHGMSGIVEGPDGKIYWGIGDIGAHIEKDGKTYKYPNRGVIVRCNPDGSDFEIFSAGHRNTHEFVFDAYGNIISSDNDGDHRGESERLVHIVEGYDAGWRANWQYGKYTDPKNNGYNVWMDEKLYVPYWEGQAAYILPPIMNYHNGPTGMQFNPGTALGSDWANKFFLVEFVGNPTNSHIWSFDLKPKGATFDLNSEVDFASGFLPTGIRFGPDGALYAADWINGWGTKNYGRVWRFDVTSDKNDLAEQRKETQRLMVLDYDEEDVDALKGYLSYTDMRIRQKAQFALVEKGRSGFKALSSVLEENKDQFARIHAIWGIGQLAAKDLNRAEELTNYLSDADPEIIAQVAKVLGDVRYGDAAETLTGLLKNDNARVKFYAAQALGRLAYKPAVQPLLDMIAENADQDLYLRHAAVLALSRIGEVKPIVELKDSDNRSLRIAAVLVLRRMEDPGLAEFLKDNDEYIVTEAARAINDDWSVPDALPALANILKETRFTSEPLLRRAINAALRVGGDEQLNNVLDFAKRDSISGVLKGEALATIGVWANPSVLDRVDGRYRGEIKRDSVAIRDKVASIIPGFLDSKDSDVLVSVASTLGNLGITDENTRLYQMVKANPSPRVRAAALDALGKLDYDNIAEAMKLGMNDGDQQVRRAALGLVPQLDLDTKQLTGIVNPIFTKGTVGEQQTMMTVLGEMPIGTTREVLSGLITKAKGKKLRPEVLLDLEEAVTASGDSLLMKNLGMLDKKGTTVADFQETLYGGSWWPGQAVFTSNPTAQCVRCHAVGGSGGAVGPPLDNIGNTLSREQILQALIEPSARIAPGYGTVTITYTDDQTVTGVLIEEKPDELLLRTAEAEPLRVPKARIKKRVDAISSMPPMGLMLTKREVRDLIEYLSSLKNVTVASEGHGN